MRTIKFVATLPDLDSAINLPGSHARAARIKLDIPMSDLLAVMELKTYGTEHVLRVTVEIEEEAVVTLAPPPGEYVGLLGGGSHAA